MDTNFENYPCEGALKQVGSSGSRESLLSDPESLLGPYTSQPQTPKPLSPKTPNP